MLDNFDLLKEGVSTRSYIGYCEMANQTREICQKLIGIK